MQQEPDFLVNYLKDAYYNVPDLDGNVELDESMLNEYRADTKSYTYTFQSGYLTIKEYIEEGNMYRLGFPNDEVRYGFLKNLFLPILLLDLMKREFQSGSL